MRRHIGTIAALSIAIACFLLPGRADAGVSFGISIANSNFGLSLGYSDYPVYSDAWRSPSWSLDFNVALGGYGDWIEVDHLGRVWRPYVAAGWRPYTYGRWVYTDFGWTWVAYEPWGYIPHHYGSWALTTFGWVWAPGYTYYPANVAWISTGGYIGWYARSPYGWSNPRRAYRRGYRHGFRNGYGTGYSDGWLDARYANYVTWDHLTNENVARYVRSGSSISRLSAPAARPLRVGPDRRRVERSVGHRIRTFPVAERSVRMGGRTITAVRPEGVTRSISTYARETVRTGLSPAVARRLETGRGSAVTRSGIHADRVSATHVRSAARTSRVARRPTIRNRSITSRSGGLTTLRTTGSSVGRRETRTVRRSGRSSGSSISNIQYSGRSITRTRVSPRRINARTASRAGRRTSESLSPGRSSSTRTTRIQRRSGYYSGSRISRSSVRARRSSSAAVTRSTHSSRTVRSSGRRTVRITGKSRSTRVTRRTGGRRIVHR